MTRRKMRRFVRVPTARRSRVTKVPAIRLLAPIVVLLVALTACGSRTSGGGPSATTAPSTPTSGSATPSHTATPATWQMLAPAPAVLRTAMHRGSPITAVWDGEEVLMVTKLLVANPDDCNTVGAAYSPAKNAWRALPPFRGVGNCYEPLTWDKAVWDGKEMLIWGTTNAAFNPSTNTWRHLPPSPLKWASPAFAVWTGRQMIGWGGGAGDAVTGEGAAFTPATNSWKRLPPAPLAGNGRVTTGAWTGHEVVVAGGMALGRRGMHLFRDAAAYDPGSGTWRRLAPMPIAQWASAAVWDGHDVLLTSGEVRRTPGTTEPQTRILAYDPASDRWRWIADLEYPREGAASIWTGTELVVWGGTLGTQIPPHGEVYHPATDAWTAMPRSPLRARTGPVAVWTGTSVVFWGGQDARTWNWTEDGAAFTPASP